MKPLERSDLAPYAGIACHPGRRPAPGFDLDRSSDSCLCQMGSSAAGVGRRQDELLWAMAVRGRRRFEVRFRPGFGSAGVAGEARQPRREGRARAVRRAILAPRAQVRPPRRASPSLGGLAGRQPGGGGASCSAVRVHGSVKSPTGRSNSSSSHRGPQARASLGDWLDRPNSLDDLDRLRRVGHEPRASPRLWSCRPARRR
jgi:hypothetical protein